MKDALENRPDFQDVTASVVARTVLIQKDEHFMVNIYLYLLEQEINAMKTNDCEGFEMDCAGQIDHLEGCLMEWDKAVEVYLTKAQNEVSCKDMIRVYHQVMKYVGEPCQTKGDELEQLIRFKLPQDLKAKLENVPTGIRHHQLI